ncbi:MAG: acetylxylan esterase [Kiritimatiellae bacterium]|nr:acetylxylan esterase [Kiritimatiellia bacterium]
MTHSRRDFLKSTALMGAVAVASFAAMAAVPVEFKVSTDHSNCLYRCGEKAAFTVTVADQSGKALQAGRFKAKLDNFGERVLAEKEFDLAQGNPFTIAAAKDSPGFMRLSFSADTNEFKLPKTPGQGVFCWGVAYEPEKIRPGAENPADFDSFWAHAVKKLDETVPPDVRLEKVDAKSSDSNTYYRISFATSGGRRVWGWLNMPAGEGPFPVRVNVPGAGIGALGTEISDETISLTMNVHSYPQPDTDAERQAAYKAQDEKYAAPRGVARYCQAGIHLSREDYFYYASILGINRAVNWLWNQPQVNRQMFTYSGTSQGGGFGLMLTALNGHFTKSCIFVPAITDLLGSRHEGRQSGWPRIIEAQQPENRAAAEKNAPYFDGVNFAARITCPVRVVVGFADCVCAPAGVYAAYNLIPSKDKEIIHGIGMGHSVYSKFYKQLRKWEATPVHAEEASVGADSKVRVKASDGLAEHAKVAFDLPVAADWKVLAQTGEGIRAGRAWLPVGSGKTVPWYVLLHDGAKTYGFGVKVQPRAMCAWRVKPGKVELLLDLRAGGQPLELGARTLEACEVVRCESAPGESAYATGRRLCSLMCPKPHLLKEPMIGFNDWYAAYGRNTATNFLADAEFVVSLCKGAAAQPYVVMDDGWQKFSPPEIERLTGSFGSGYGPWEESSSSFGMDMKTFCSKIAALGARPGLWYRPLCIEGNMCDPSDPAVLARISADIRRFREWGFKFVKIDYLTFDWCGHFKGFDDTGRLIRDKRRWNDSKHTTAETIVGLYRTMREAAGDDMVILGCNAVNHLCAGLFEASRVGPDTSGKDWEQTKRNGVGAVAFKGIENGTLFAADPDCAGLASEGAIPWEKNRLWIDLLSRSGMPFFISWRRTLADAEVRETLSAAFRRAAQTRKTAEAQDWLETSVPSRWLTADGLRTYAW